MLFLLHVYRNCLKNMQNIAGYTHRACVCVFIYYVLIMIITTSLFIKYLIHYYFIKIKIILLQLNGR